MRTKFSFFLCAAVTSLNALVGAGFSIASVLAPHADAHLALYGVSRSAPIAIAALLVARGGSVERMLLLCYLTAAIQFGDALIGWHGGDLGKTLGPLLLALTTAGAGAALRRAARRRPRRKKSVIHCGPPYRPGGRISASTHSPARTRRATSGIDPSWSPTHTAGLLLFAARFDMRDKKDNATFDLPGFGAAGVGAAAATPSPEPKRAARVKKPALKQVQLELLEATDNSGLPVWTRDERLDLTGLPIWAPA